MGETGFTDAAYEKAPRLRPWFERKNREPRRWHYVSEYAPSQWMPLRAKLLLLLGWEVVSMDDYPAHFPMAHGITLEQR